MDKRVMYLEKFQKCGELTVAEFQALSGFSNRKAAREAILRYKNGNLLEFARFSEKGEYVYHLTKQGTAFLEKASKKVEQ